MKTLSEEELTDMLDTSFVSGQRTAWMSLLSRCLKELSINEDISKEALILEREDAIQALRSLCADHGDNDWEEDLHLADVINKHLGNHLYSAETED